MLPKHALISISIRPLKITYNQNVSTLSFWVKNVRNFSPNIHQILIAYQLRDLSRATLHNMTYSAIRCWVWYFGLKNENIKNSETDPQQSLQLSQQS
jgi:hypothetical protein